MLFTLLLSFSAFLVAQRVKSLPAVTGYLDLIPGSGRSPREGNGNPLQYSCLRIPWTEEPAGLWSMGSQRVRHSWATSFSFFLFLLLWILTTFPSWFASISHKFLTLWGKLYGMSSELTMLLELVDTRKEVACSRGSSTHYLNQQVYFVTKDTLSARFVRQDDHISWVTKISQAC